MAIPQLDLFAFDDPAPKAVAPAVSPAPRSIPVRETSPLFPTPPTLAWARKLTEAGCAGNDCIFQVNLLWTRQVVEVLSRGAMGRELLFADGHVQDITPDSSARGRLIYLDPDAVRALHEHHPLEQFGPVGTHSAFYRFASPGAPKSELWVPTGTRDGGCPT